MINTIYARRGIAVAPHSLAAQSALAVLREGGDAIEAMVAAAATIAVAYPHMNGIGGDSFWLIAAPGARPTAVDACGPAARNATIRSYSERGLAQIPPRGALAANTVAGTIAGWELALSISRNRWGGRMPLARLLEDAIHYAEHGVPVTASQEANTRAKRGELESVPGFAARFMPGGEVPARGTLFVQKPLAATLRRLAEAGLADFQRGDLARSMAQDLAALGSPLALADLDAYAAQEAPPLELAHSVGRLFNMRPPTQGVVSLAILGILERLRVSNLEPEGADYVHAVVEATKAAFLGIRDPHVADPAHMRIEPQSLLDSARLDALAAEVDMKRARPWGAV
ncbi:MAG: gamma-glutamyltransferase, partial [Burkholderiales bacterium]